MQASDVMTRSVVSVAPDTALPEVVKLLLEHRISGVPVVDDGAVVGFVGHGELLHRHEIGTDDAGAGRSWWQRLLQVDPTPQAYVRSHGGHARDVMDPEVTTVTEDTPLARLAVIFETRSIRRLPVLRDGRMVGLVTRADLVRALAARCASSCEANAQASDAQIQAQLMAELAHQTWWSEVWSNVSVQQGVVRFTGVVRREADKDAARIAAENIPGVRAVEDERRPASELQPIL